MAAHNLAWKLSLILDDLCPDPEKLLSSYSAEVSMTNIMYSQSHTNCPLHQREPIIKMTMDYLGECMKTGLEKQGSIRGLLQRKGHSNIKDLPL